jgi:heat shock protein HslJ
MRKKLERILVEIKSLPATVVVITALTLAGCAPRDASNAAGADEVPAGETTALVGTIWRLEDLGGEGVLRGVEATLRFPEPGKVAGNGSCNRFFGNVEIVGQSINIGPLTATKKSCVMPVLDQEASYFVALESAYGISVQGAELLIYYAAAQAPLRFTRVKPRYHLDSSEPGR